jgi:hypothetical protein
LIFFIFQPTKIHASPTGVISSLSPPRCRPSFDRHCHIIVSCHTSFSLSQDEIAAFASSFGNVLSRCLPSRAKTETLNSHHRRRLSPPPLVDHPTHTLYCYKKVISTLATFPTTQSRLHFTSSLAKALRHRSSTHHHHYLSPLSHVHGTSAQ